jgi:hypothetical protein
VHAEVHIDSQPLVPVHVTGQATRRARTAKVTGEDMDKVLLLMTVSILGKMRPDGKQSFIKHFLLPASSN